MAERGRHHDFHLRLSGAYLILNVDHALGVPTDIVAMQTILGPFHPDLETAFVDAILTCKATDLLSPVLVLTPSDSLRRRLKFLLARERGLALLNLQLLTFHQLALRLREESNGPSFDVQRDLFFEEALRQLIRRRCPGADVAG